MSSAEPIRRRTPRLAEAVPASRRALAKARLTVVPQRIEQAGRVPFIAVVSVLALLGVVTLLMFNTSLQQASFAATALESKANTLTEREEALKQDVEGLRSPVELARQAQAQGMTLPSSPDFLSLQDGKVLRAGNGEPPSKLMLNKPPAAKPDVLNPAPVYVTAPERKNDRGGDTGERSPTGDDRDGSNGEGR